MAFKIYYNHADLTRIAANIRQAMVDHRPHAQEIWRGGLDKWANSPLASPDKNNGDPGVREVTIGAGNVDHMQILMRTIGSRVLGAAYMLEMAADLPNHAENVTGKAATHE